MLDLFNDKVVSVDYNRDQGFLTGMGIDVKDKKKNGDEAKTGNYTGGKGGDYTIVCNEPTQRQPGRRQDRDGDLPGQEPGHQPGLHDQRAGRRAAPRGAEGRRQQGALIVSVDGGCAGRARSSRTASSAPPRSSTR